MMGPNGRSCALQCRRDWWPVPAQQAVDEGNNLGIRFWVRSLGAYALISIVAVAVASRAAAHAGRPERVMNALAARGAPAGPSRSRRDVAAAHASRSRQGSA